MKTRLELIFGKPALAALVLVTGFMTTSAALAGGTGSVISVNERSHTFSCGRKSNYTTYKTTGKTVYWLGRTRASWSDLRVGDVVIEVISHLEENYRVADTVQISTYDTVQINNYFETHLISEGRRDRTFYPHHKFRK